MIRSVLALNTMQIYLKLLNSAGGNGRKPNNKPRHAHHPHHKTNASFYISLTSSNVF